MSNTTSRGRVTAKAVPHGLLALLCILAVGLPHNAGAQESRFRSGVDMVALTVTVTDANGHSVSGLTADSFAVYEEGVWQTVSLFGGEDIPVDVALVLDTSSSVTNALPVIKTAARAIVDTLRPGDRAAVIDLKDKMDFAQPLTDDRQRVLAAVDALHASGSTAFYDGMYATLREFERERRQHRALRRQALVVLSDGVDTVSRLSFDDVTELARTLDVTIYTIGLRDAKPATGPVPEPFRRATWELRSIAKETGGLVFFPVTVAELQHIYDTIARELTSQYAVGYVSSAPRRDKGYTLVALKLLPPHQGTARTRTGYLAKGSPR